MARTKTREIVRVCTEVAKLDRRGKEEVLIYLQQEIAALDAKHESMCSIGMPVTYREGGEK